MTTRLLGCILSLAIVPLCHAQQTPVPASIVVQPAALEIKQQRHPFLLQVLGATADGYTLDLAAQAKYSVGDTKVATVDAEGWVRPVGNGQTQVTVSVAGVTKTVAVKVQMPAV